MDPSTARKSKAYVVSVSMGFGHQRAAHALRGMHVSAEPINANDYDGIPDGERKIWENSRVVYEFISNSSRIPIIGWIIFLVLNKITQILNFYPQRNLSESNLSTKYVQKLISKGWGKHLIDKASSTYPPLPFISTFFAPAFMAEEFNYPAKVYCVVTDTDLARTWVKNDPTKSNIIYLAPTIEAKRRLVSYGVAEEKIKLTGFPLPIENIGENNYEIARSDLARRIINLDPSGTYRKLYAPLIEKYIGKLPDTANRPLTIMISLGGAAAQRDTLLFVTNNLFKKLRAKEIRLILAIGIKKSVRNYVEFGLKMQHLIDLVGENITILEGNSVWDYFDQFNVTLRETDILWTKPSELSFYAGLGIPLLIAPPIGSQEEFNRDWLIGLHAGLPQQDPMYTDEWLWHHLNQGHFAEAAMHGFIEIEKDGVKNIEKEVFGDKK